MVAAWRVPKVSGSAEGHFTQVSRSRSPLARHLPRGVASWLQQLERDSVVLSERTHSNPRHLSEAAARLVDTVERGRLTEVVQTLDSRLVERHAGLSYAKGYLALLDHAEESAMRWLTRAHALAGGQAEALQARITFELGALYLSRESFVPGEVLLLDMEGIFIGEPSPDLVHLRALAAGSMGDDRHAEDLYRAAIRSGREAFTPATRILAMINLAASANQHDPDEALMLCELAVALIDAHRLDTRLRAAANNVMGYALICLGRLAEARSKTNLASVEARASGNARVSAYASFNQAIIDELEGDVARSADQLRRLHEHCRADFPDLAGWATVRSLWLRCLAGWSDEDDGTLIRAKAAIRSTRYSEALLCIESVVHAERAEFAVARSGFEAIRRSAQSRGDVLTAFTMTLRLAQLEKAVGRSQRARSLAKQAMEILNRRAFRLSPNWWSSDLVADFRSLTFLSEIEARLLPPRSPSLKMTRRQQVQLTRDGQVLKDGAAVSLRWEAGRTGRRVLFRLYRALLSAYPRGMPRDELADALWPESEGDAAVRNLYAATNDLRKILADAPGLGLACADRGYRLALEDNVTLTN